VSEPLRDTERLIDEAGDRLEAAVQAALEALERAGFSAKVADDFIKECVFNAWMGWDYEPSIVEALRGV
jgi:hypothetical protein